jgi:hypothetical protein
MKSTCNTERALPTFRIHPKTNPYESRFQLTSWRITHHSASAGIGNCTGFSYSTAFSSIDIGIEKKRFYYQRSRLRAERPIFSAIKTQQIFLQTFTSLNISIVLSADLRQMIRHGNYCSTRLEPHTNFYI